VGGVWLAAFLSLYVTVYAQQGESRYMQSFWAPQALGAQATLAAGGELAFHAVLDPGFALGKKFPLLLLIATGLFYLVGLARVPLLASVPILLVIIAAALGKWVSIERLMLFYLPPTLLAIAYGLETIAALRRDHYTAVILPILLALFPLKAVSWIARHPAYRRFERPFSSPSALLSPETLYTAMPSPYRLGFSTPPIGAHQIKSESPGIRWHPARAVILPGIFLRERPPCNTKDSRHHEGDGRLEIVGRPDGLFRSTAGPRLGDDGWTENEYDRVRLQPAERAVFVGLSVVPGGRGFSDLEEKFLHEGAKPI